MDQQDLDRHGWPCPTGEEMGAIDRAAIEGGLPGRLLMESAGRALARAARQRFGRVRRPLIACGPGNNGGDGFVVARVLREWDRSCEPIVVSLADPERLSPEARANLELLPGAGVEVVTRRPAHAAAELAPRCDLIVDAVFGVGVNRAVSGDAADLLDALARAARPCLAVDLPSGWSADADAAFGPAPEADLIVTLGLPKLGLALRAGAPPIQVADIGLPASARAAVEPRQRWLTPRAAAALLPRPGPEAHKGSFGHVLVVAGSEGKTGAAVLAATAAARAGAGLVTAACARSLHPVLEQSLVEPMSLPLPDRDGVLGEAAAEVVLRELAARDVGVVGPGLGTAPETVRALEAILKSARAPLVVDADALNAFEGRPEALDGPGPRVLTPHPGEAGRLLGSSSAAVQQDRVASARTLAGRSRAVVVLKGARTLVADPEGRLWINPTGGIGLASGGSGDVLAGVIGALLAQGLEPCEAARLGVWMHGAAGDRGPGRGGLAREVAAALPAVRARLERARAEDGGDGEAGLRRFE